MSEECIIGSVVLSMSRKEQEQLQSDLLERMRHGECNKKIQKLESELTALRSKNERLRIDNHALKNALSNQMQCVQELKEYNHGLATEVDRLRAEKRELVEAIIKHQEICRGWLGGSGYGDVLTAAVAKHKEG